MLSRKNVMEKDTKKISKDKDNFDCEKINDGVKNLLSGANVGRGSQLGAWGISPEKQIESEESYDVGILKHGVSLPYR